MKAVLFDWDGTLLDSAAASFSCYVRLFESFGIAFTRELFATAYSPDWYRTYSAVGLPKERWSEADARWVELYSRESCALLPRAAASLSRLREAGVSTGLVTSGSRARVARDLSRLCVASLFETVVCSEDVPEKKPDPAPLRLALSKLDVASESAAFIGDSPEDVEMARAAGVLSVAIPGAFPNREALESAGPDFWAADLWDAATLLLK